MQFTNDLSHINDCNIHKKVQCQDSFLLKERSVPLKGTDRYSPRNI